jgi:endonuclease-3 related protein
MTEINNSYDLFKILKGYDLLNERGGYWWPNYGTFEVVIGAVLTQNTKWSNVEISLQNLKKLDLLSIEALKEVDIVILTNAIAKSGFKNQKSKRLKLLANNIFNEFGMFENFTQSVDREWLLSQKGIGLESADSILCYACGRDEMVVDSYTNRLLKRYEYEFESYDELKSWLEEGINQNYDKIIALYSDKNITLNKIYARFHGKIVEYMKNEKKVN